MKFSAAILLRAMISCFIYLTLEFSRMFISSSIDTHPLMAIWADIFFEVTVIIIFNLLYREESLGRDTNTLNCYALVFHLIYIPFYLSGYQVKEYHNCAIMFLEGVFVLRLFYFGKRELFLGIAIIGQSKQWLLDRYLSFNSYINGLTIALFALCAVPLCTLIYLINTDKMRVTGIAVILFTFFVAFENAKKRAAGHSTEMDLPIGEAGKDESAMMTKEEFTIFELRSSLKILGIAMVVLMLLFPTTIDHYQKLFFDMGYASGFTDAKSKAPPKKETDFETAVKCVMEANTRMPQPPGKGCLDRK